MTRRGWAELFAIVAPPACLACRATLPRADALLCAACLRGMPWLRGWRCPRCALPRHGRSGCGARAAAYDAAWAAMAYEGSARALVQALKLRGALPAAGVMAAQIAATLPSSLPGPAASSGLVPLRDVAASPGSVPPRDAAASRGAKPPLRAGAGGSLAGAVVVAVPPQPSRRRQRGFDPAGALARSLAPRLGAPLAAALMRRDRAGRQARAGRTARRADGRIVVEATREVGLPVLLVDDVHTTGATLDACARALRGAGAPSVVAVSYARTLLSSASGT